MSDETSGRRKRAANRTGNNTRHRDCPQSGDAEKTADGLFLVDTGPLTLCAGKVLAGIGLTARAQRTYELAERVRV